MSRISGIKAQEAEASASAVLQGQKQVWGDFLNPYLIYARRPSILKSVGGMWEALSESGLLPGTLTTLICRRVAAINGCVF